MKWTLSFPESFIADVKRAAKENRRSFSDEIVVRFYRDDIPKMAANVDAGELSGTIPKNTEEYRKIPNFTSAIPKDTEEYRNLSQSSPASGLTLREQLEAVDAKPGGGSWQNPESANRKRRKAQILLLSKAWHEMFPNAFQLTERSAKGFLSKTGDMAAPVYDAFTVTAEHGVDGMGVVGYISTVLANTQVSTQKVESEFVSDEFLADMRRIRAQAIADGTYDPTDPDPDDA